jgi:hypothetical protein
MDPSKDRNGILLAQIRPYSPRRERPCSRTARAMLTPAHVVHGSCSRLASLTLAILSV